jgi:hypothetical protein
VVVASVLPLNVYGEAWTVERTAPSIANSTRFGTPLICAVQAIDPLRVCPSVRPTLVIETGLKPAGALPVTASASENAAANE